MPRLLALAIAALASVPGLALSYYLISGRKQSFASAWAGFQAVATYFLPFYFLGAFVFGLILWWVLLRIGQLHLVGFLVGSVVPVILALTLDAMVRGLGGGTHVAFVAFSIPCLCMGFALWAFGVRWPIGT